MFFRKNVYSTDVSLSAKIGKSTKILTNSHIDKNTKIGNYTFISSYTSVTKAIIGNYCSIGPNIKIGLGEHDYTKFSTSILFSKYAYNELTQKECFIGNDVWIDTGAVVLRGVTIGNGAVIGANAVVTKDIPPFAIAAGVPAKVIKYRFSKDKIKLLEESKWWDYPPNIVVEIIEKLNK